jgi:hypothetical protein
VRLKMKQLADDYIKELGGKKTVLYIDTFIKAKCKTAIKANVIKLNFKIKQEQRRL